MDAKFFALSRSSNSRHYRAGKQVVDVLICRRHRIVEVSIIRVKQLTERWIAIESPRLSARLIRCCQLGVAILTKLAL